MPDSKRVLGKETCVGTFPTSHCKKTNVCEKRFNQLLARKKKSTTLSKISKKKKGKVMDKFFYVDGQDRNRIQTQEDNAKELCSTDMNMSSHHSSNVNNMKSNPLNFMSVDINDEEDEFFFPIDDDFQAERGEVETKRTNGQFIENYGTMNNAAVSTKTIPTNTRRVVSKIQERKDCRDAAIAQLEAFFLGTPSTNDVQDSPISVRDFDDCSSSSSLHNESQRELHSPCQSLIITPGSRGERAVDDNEIFSNQIDTCDDTEGHQFRLLQKDDRRNTIPTENPLRKITRKSSMKKFPKCQSAGALKPSVSFSNLEIRQYSAAISDHPGCSSGPPVQLSWDYEAAQTVPVESYELSRSPRRYSHQLVLSQRDRKNILLKQAGYSKKDVKDAVKEVDRVKRERLVTDLLLPANLMAEAMDDVADSMKKIFT